MSKLKYHGPIWAIATGMMVYYLVKGKLGQNPLGTCSISEGNKWAILPVLFYVFLSSYTIYYIKAKSPDVKRFRKVKQKLINHHKKYIICTIVLWSCIGVSWLFNQ